MKLTLAQLIQILSLSSSLVRSVHQKVDVESGPVYFT